TNDVAFETAFPYVALPHSGSGAGSRGLAREGASAGSDSSGSAAPAAGSDSTDQGASTNASGEQNEDGVGTGSVVLIGLVALAIGATVGGLMSRRSATA
ncbi:MAG TPA: hypothetical protein VNA30_06690, partial [Mycobacteriales bacterium]|nr:hypothetical protein [Mycobacteriales bacterium]